jgi:hypothetical protein
MSIESKLEEGFVSLIEQIQYVIDNSVNARVFEDNSKKVNPPAVIVNCNPVRRIEPNDNKYECETDFINFTYIEDDKSRTQLKEIYSEIFDFARTLLPATLSTASTLTIDGLVMDDSGEQERDDKYNYITTKLKVYLTVI